MVIWQEHGQRKIADEAGIHQLIVFEGGRISSEIEQLHSHFSHGIMEAEARERGSFLSDSNLYGTRFNPMVTLYTIHSHFDVITRLLEKVGPRHELLGKLKSQFNRLSEIEPSIEPTNLEAFRTVHLQLQSIALSIEQLGILHSLEFKELSARLQQRIQRDNRILIGFLLMLALLSYVLTRWVSHRIAATQERFTQELEIKNAELERFVYTVSHELRSPLVSIKGFVGLLQRDIGLNDVGKVHEDIDRINHATDNLGDLLEGLLELSRIGRVINPPVSGSLNDLVNKSVTPLQGLIRERGITLEIEENMPSYWGDQLRLKEVFQNLIENAIRFMGDQPAPRVEIGARLNGAEIVCTVKDNGIGIEPQYHERVFNLFERLDPNIEGTGIGITLVKRIIEAHGGTIDIVSEGAQKGCTFVFTLPVRPDGNA